MRLLSNYLQSSEEFKVNDSCLISDILFLGGFFKGDLSAGSNLINQNIEGGGFVLGIDCSDPMELKFARFFQSTLGCSVENICDDYWGDLFVGLKFDKNKSTRRALQHRAKMILF